MKELELQIIKSFKGDYDYEIEIDDETYYIQKEVFDVIHQISIERDNLRAKQN